LAGDAGTDEHVGGATFSPHGVATMMGPVQPSHAQDGN
jgi:hypothetical protein